MKHRRLAPGARFSTRNARKHIVDPYAGSSTEHVTPEHIERVDPGGHRAVALLNKFSKKD